MTIICMKCGNEIELTHPLSVSRARIQKRIKELESESDSKYDDYECEVWIPNIIIEELKALLELEKEDKQRRR